MNKLLPILILCGAIALTTLLIQLRPAPPKALAPRPLSSVEFMRVSPTTTHLYLNSQGTLMPQTESELTLAVSGQIIEMGSNFRPGATFASGEILLRIDPTDYYSLRDQRRAELATAKLAWEREKARAQQAALDWVKWGKGHASQLAMRLPQLEQAETQVQSAQSALAQSERDLARTEVKAPYAGTVLTQNVDLGQYITAQTGTSIGRIFASNNAEIRLPITQQDALLLDQTQFGAVQLRSNDSPNGSSWSATIDRIEANIDPHSRLLYVVARITQAFQFNPISQQPQLRRGMFLQAQIQGRSIEDAYILPHDALRGSDTVYILNPENRLQTRQVQVVQSTQQQVIISAGLQDGERIAISPIGYFVENMAVNPIEKQ